MTPPTAEAPPSRGPAIVLVRPQLAENIGMCARAMANFGLSDLRLVAPRDGWPQKARLKKGARAASAGATGVLDRATLHDTVEAAVADLGYVWATTARERGQGKPVIEPSVAMASAAAAMPADAEPRVPHGILFGPERTGLDSDDIALADAVVTFPVDPAFASLNLAQAVLLMGYEWFRAANGPRLPFATPEYGTPAARATVLSFFTFLEEELAAAGHFIPENKRPIMVRNLRNILHRIGLTEQDTRTLRGVVVSLAKGRARRAKPAPDTKT